MAEAETKRGTTWPKALLAIWGDSKIQEELDGAVRNKVVFERIASSEEKKVSCVTKSSVVLK